MCHSATVRPTHGVVVGRAVLVPWNPAATESKTFHGFCAPSGSLTMVQTFGALVGARDFLVQNLLERRPQSRTWLALRLGSCSTPFWGAAVGRSGRSLRSPLSEKDCYNPSARSTVSTPQAFLSGSREYVRQRRGCQTLFGAEVMELRPPGKLWGVRRMVPGVKSSGVRTPPSR